ncbi:MAG: polysaccharide biosynthesis/export family protein, partial [Chthonomonadaceae bacterium]|nr:polysaccharide biosynthesis/export family protein [Chthonomonadaceae bacterium]
MLRQFALFLLLILALVAPAQTKERIIAPGDTVRLTCEEEPSLNGPYKITRDGLIVMKFIGAVKVSGLTTAESGLKIRDQLL